MDTKQIASMFSAREELNCIRQQLKDWDLSTVEGEGTHVGSMHSKFGHIKLKVYQSTVDTLIWNVSQDQLPDEFRYQLDIENLLRFFIGYIAGLREDKINLTFEIVGGSYHVVDSTKLGIVRATMYALINCFDKSFLPHL